MTDKNKDLEYVSCNICDKDETVLISEKGQFNLPINVVLCQNCGLGYLNPRWTREKYMDFYKNEYDRYYRPDLNRNEKRPSQALNPIYDRLLKRNLLGAPNTILDIGSGAGENLGYFKNEFPEAECYAIEPSREAVIILKNNGIHILSTDVDSNWAEEKMQHFDFIIMRHVLEHFSDPVGVLQKVSKALAPNGLLYLAVPNSLKPTTPLQTNWFRVVHTYYFNKHSLENILIKSGLNSLEIVEGDKFQEGELFTFVKKSTQKIKMNLDCGHYIEQKEVFDRKLVEENKVWPTLRRKIKYFRQKTRL